MCDDRAGLPPEGTASWAEVVLDLVEGVPPGRVTTYGLLAEAAKMRTGRGGPRQVGQLMSREGGGVPWWRVVRANGTLPEHLAARALAHYRDEGTPLRPGGGPDLRAAIWDPLADDVSGEDPRA